MGKRTSVLAVLTIPEGRRTRFLPPGEYEVAVTGTEIDGGNILVRCRVVSEIRGIIGFDAGDLDMSTLVTLKDKPGKLLDSSTLARPTPEKEREEETDATDPA